MNVGVIGSGVVGRTLAAGFLKHGHRVAIGTRNPAKLAHWAAAHPAAAVKSFAGAAQFGDVVALAVCGEVALDALRQVGDAAIDGKPVIDACNPIGGALGAAGERGVFGGQCESLMERLQAAFPRAYFVKAFNSVGVEQMVDPQFAGLRPTMFICGDDAWAKTTVAAICGQFGWAAADMGAVEAARAIEPMSNLWWIPDVAKKGAATHAFSW